VAKLAGGARMMDFENDSNPIGDRNLSAARSVLDSYGISVTETDTGEDIGRTVTVDAENGLVSIQRSDGTNVVI
jgi:chemotaxis protein CheD